MSTTEQAWRDAVVEQVRRPASDVCELTVVTGEPVPAAPGAHVDVKVVEAADDVRSYSLVRCEDAGARLTIAVRLSPSSAGGSRFVHSLQVGDPVRISRPRQKFPLRAHAPRYVLVAGGIGITPILPMAQTLHRLGADYTLVYAGRSRESMPFLDELTQTHGTRLDIRVTDEGTRLDVDELVASVAANGVPGTEMYLCGPISLMDAVRHRWGIAGLPPANLRLETFGNSGAYPAEEFTVRVPRLDVEVTVPKDTTILEALERADVDVMFDCREGECGLCAVKILATTGVIDHRDVFFSDEQKKRNEKLCACVSRVAHSPMARPDGGRPAVTLDLP